MVLDEPTSALDLKHIREMGKCMKQCASEGDIVIVSLHEISFAMDIADEVLVCKGGGSFLQARQKRCSPQVLLRACLVLTLRGQPMRAEIATSL